MRRSEWSPRSRSGETAAKSTACSWPWRTTAVLPPEQMLALVKPVKCKAFGVNVDTGSFRTADPYGDLARIVPYGVVSQVKTEIAPGGKKRKRTSRGSSRC